jgi:AbiU2
MDAKELFEKYLKALFQELTRIDSFFELSIHIDKYRSNRLNELNIAPSFFGSVLDSFIYTTVVSLARYYDSYKTLKRSDRNLIRFINFVEQHIELFPTDVDIIKRLNIIYPVTLDLIQHHKGLIHDETHILEKLFTWRDKHFG